MYISELKIQGFKTFVKKTSLTFGEGITTVVGPNGCGKTNIVDAIRWVLGEQKTSVLRGGKLEDVIFNGAEGLKPLSMCEVSLTVHNNKGKLPIEYNDVEITRRAFRDGESEYFINRTLCRLKDIHDLFMDTGMGADAYSVIELGMIESILSETRDDRKHMFEEAAGINKYKLERRSALRKFDAVRADLERINDIVGEVESKVHNLALQLKRFKRHAGLVEKLREKDLALAFLRIDYYKGQALPLEQRIAELKHLRESTVTSGNRQDQELQRLKEMYRTQREELDGIKGRLAEAESEREETRNGILVRTEQQRAAGDSITRLENETTNIIAKQDELRRSVANFTENVLEIDPQIEEKLELYQQKKAEFEQAEDQYKNSREKVRELQAERWQHQQKASEQNSLLQRTEQMLADFSQRRQKITDRREELLHLQTADKDVRNGLEASQHDLQAQLARRQAAFEQEELALNQYRERRQELEQNRQSARNRLETSDSQLRFYQELIEKSEGYPAGVRQVLARRQDYPGVLGSLSELISVPDEYGSALENALGPLAYCLVAEDRASALEVLNLAGKNKAGHLTILPLQEIAALPARDRATPAAGQPLVRALDLVMATEQIQPLVRYLLGDLLLVTDLAAALQDRALAGWDLLDREGRFAGSNQILKNSTSAAGSGVIGRRQKITDLEQQIAQTNEDLERQTRELQELDTLLEKHQRSVGIIRANIVSLSEQASTAENQLIRNQYRQSQTDEALTGIKQEIDELTAQILASEAALTGLQPAVAAFTGELADIDQKITAANEQSDRGRLNRDNLSRQVQDLRIETMGLENQREKLLFQKRTADETIAELDNRQVAIKAEIESLQQQRETLSAEMASAEKALESINSRIKQQRSVLDLKQTVFDETYQSIDDLEARMRAEQKDREALLEELRDCEVRGARYREQIRTIRERIEEKYRTVVPDGLIVDESEEELVREIDRLQHGIDAIGPINMAVQAEHTEEEERLQIICAQRADLIASEENLRETIKKIDRVARKRFLDTFTQIKSNFERMFAMFFEGGEGTLSLAGDPDPLEADIAIFAQPPGKRNQSLRVLSAGEKALTAIALLFSIYQVKPSPYCILDEVDAPLDDVNIRKFTRVLHKFSDETQFIVVTHNKLTMEAANYLYGVTMERKGVSKLVSVKFED
ncbi:MAG: chromosome segregation protein SMC [Candidatus Neomarinimicrobiota bacterium]